MQRISSKDPAVAKILRAALPMYRKHNVFVSASDGGIQVNSYWDGGSRSTFVLLNLNTMRTQPLPTQSHPYFDVARNVGTDVENSVVSVDHVGNVTLKALPEGYALIEAGTFCGKPATAHLYLNPANFAKLLP